MITVRTLQGESKIVAGNEGFAAIYAGGNKVVWRWTELAAALDLVETIEQREGPLMAYLAREQLRTQLEPLGYHL